jgi:hypothetical protein
VPNKPEKPGNIESLEERTGGKPAFLRSFSKNLSFHWRKNGSSCKEMKKRAIEQA